MMYNWKIEIDARNDSSSELNYPLLNDTSITFHYPMYEKLLLFLRHPLYMVIAVYLDCNFKYFSIYTFA